MNVKLTAEGRGNSLLCFIRNIRNIDYSLTIQILQIKKHLAAEIISWEGELQQNGASDLQ